MLRCSAIIVTYNSGASIGACLEALARRGLRDRGRGQRLAGRHGAAGGGVRRLARAAPAGQRRAILALPPQSTRAHATATGDVLLVLNPDAIAEPGAVKALLQLHGIDAGARQRAARCWELTASRRAASRFDGCRPSAALLCEAMLVNQLWPRNPVNRRYRCLDADYSQQQEVEQPAGACLAITRAAWDRSRRLRRAVLPGVVRGCRSLQAAARARREESSIVRPRAFSTAARTAWASCLFAISRCSGTATCCAMRANTSRLHRFRACA